MKGLSRAYTLMTMSKRPYAAALLLFLLSCTALSAESREILRTRWFDIIYSPQSAESAALVASRADGYAEEICALLETDVKKRMPVYIEPGISVLNAHFSPYPYDHIVLYDTLPSDGDLANNTDSLLAVFYHELTHALSLTIRTPFWQFMSSVFGDFISVNSALTMPLSFMEGVTVSFESLGGEGRLADPAALQLLAQDKLEGRFLSWKEAAGARDVYPGGRAHYLYGGFFARWLQRTFGMEKYSLFWNRGAAFNLLESNAQTRFRQTYGITLDQAWERFERSVPVPPLIRHNERTLAGTAEGVQSLLDSRSGRTVWLDLDAEAVFLRDRDGTVRRLLDADGTVSRLALSPNGSELLLSRAVRSGAEVTDRAEIFDIDRNAYSGETFPGIREAAFLDTPGRIVAVRVRGQRESLFWFHRADPGRERELLTAGPGEARTLMLSPVDAGTGAVACLCVSGIERSIAIIDPDTGAFESVNLNGQLRFVRYLARGDRNGSSLVTFGWTDENTFYRAALWDPREAFVELQYVDFSGGVYYPVWDDGLQSVVYVANLSGRTRLQELNAGFFARSTLTEPADGDGLILAGADAGPEGEAPSDRAGQNQTGFAIYPYSPVPWLFDGVFLPIPKRGPRRVSRATGNVLPGFLYVTGSPTERSAYQLQGAFSVDPFFVDFSLGGEWIAGPGTFIASLSDALQPYANGYDAYRDLSAIAGFAAVTRFTPSWNRLTATVRLVNHWYGRSSDLDGALYGEPFASASCGADGQLEWRAIRSASVSRFPLFAVTASGPLAALYGWAGIQLPDGVTTRVVQGRLQWLTPAIPLSLQANALVSDGLIFGSSKTRTDAESARDFESGVTRLVARFPEYNGTDMELPGSSVAVSVEAEAIPLTLEIQRGVPFLPVYANRIVAAGGYRGGWFGDAKGDLRYVDSGYARLSVQGALLFGALSNVVLSVDAYYTRAIRREGYDAGVTFLSSFSL